MAKYSVEFSPEGEKAFEKLDNSVKTRIKNWIRNNLEGCENPRWQGKALHGTLSNYWRYRVGDYRIVTEIQDKKVVILIVDVDKRNDVYK